MAGPPEARDTQRGPVKRVVGPPHKGRPHTLASLKTQAASRDKSGDVTHSVSYGVGNASVKGTRNDINRAELALRNYRSNTGGGSA